MGFDSARAAGQRVHAAFNGTGTAPSRDLTPDEREDREARMDAVRAAGAWHAFWAGGLASVTLVFAILTWSAFDIAGLFGFVPLVATFLCGWGALGHAVNAWAHFTFRPENMVREGEREEGGILTFR